MEKGLFLNVIDSVNSKVFTISTSKSSFVSNKEIPQNLTNAILAMHYILNNDETCSPRQPRSLQSDPKCKFYYANILTNNLLLNNMLTTNEYKNSKDLFFKLKKYFTVKWLNSNFTQSQFFEFYVNYTYFGNNTIGLSGASSKYFGITNPSRLNLIQSVYLAEEIYKNNSYIYGTYNKDLINTDTILSALVSLKYITPEQARKAKATRLVKKSVSNNNLHSLYANMLITTALPYTTETNNVNIYTTLNSNIQTNSAAQIATLLGANSIPSAAVEILHRGKIVTEFITSLENGKNLYYETFPTVQIRYLLRPVSYLALLQKNQSIPKQLLSQEVQNLIIEQQLSPLNYNSKYFPNFTQENGEPLKQTVELSKLAIKLIGIEENFFNKLSNSDYSKILKNMHLDTKSFVRNSSGKPSLEVPFNTLMDTYAIFAQGGDYVFPPYILQSINDHKFTNNINTTNIISSAALNSVVDGVIRQDIATSNLPFKVIYDNNVAIAFFKDYTIGIWLGDLKLTPSQNAALNRYNVLQKAILPLVDAVIAADSKLTTSTKKQETNKDTTSNNNSNDKNTTVTNSSINNKSANTTNKGN